MARTLWKTRRATGAPVVATGAPVMPPDRVTIAVDRRAAGEHGRARRAPGFPQATV